MGLDKIANIFKGNYVKNTFVHVDDHVDDAREANAKKSWFSWGPENAAKLSLTADQIMEPAPLHLHPAEGAKTPNERRAWSSLTSEDQDSLPSLLTNRVADGERTLVKPAHHTLTRELSSWKSLIASYHTASSSEESPSEVVVTPARPSPDTRQSQAATEPSGRGQKSRRAVKTAQPEFDEEFGRLALWTTRMVRNIPNDYTREDLIGLLTMHDLNFDFVYLPIDWATKANLGYAFVNLTSADEAARGGSMLNGFQAWARDSGKVCEIKWGNPEKQGLANLIGEYRNSPVMHPDVPVEFQPLIFQQKEAVPFPEPSKKFRLPRGLRREVRDSRQTKKAT